MTPTTELAEKLERLDKLFVDLYNYAEQERDKIRAGDGNAVHALNSIRHTIGGRYNVIPQAADTLRKQAEELERCRTALRPFAEATLLNQSALIIAGDGITQAFDSGKKHVTIIMEDDAAKAFNAARSAYNEPKQNGEAK